MSKHLVIMAGGIGSRFWPMSTSQCPKQFLDIIETGGDTGLEGLYHSRT